MYPCSAVRRPLLNVRKGYDGVRSSWGICSQACELILGVVLFSRRFEDRIIPIFRTKTARRFSWLTTVPDLQLARMYVPIPFPRHRIGLGTVL